MNLLLGLILLINDLLTIGVFIMYRGKAWPLDIQAVMHLVILGIGMGLLLGGLGGIAGKAARLIVGSRARSSGRSG